MSAQPSLRAVRCEPDDACLILDWRNDPVTRAMSFDTAERGWEEFWSDFRDRFPAADAPAPQFLVINGAPVAYLRFDPARPAAGCAVGTMEVSINVDPTRRRQGYGKTALRLAEHYLAARGCERILAAVKSDNAVSKKLFEAVGYEDEGRFQVVPEDGTGRVEVIRYIRTIPQTRVAARG